LCFCACTPPTIVHRTFKSGPDFDVIVEIANMTVIAGKARAKQIERQWFGPGKTGRFLAENGSR
jgi:hypothetical protein